MKEKRNKSVEILFFHLFNSLKMKQLILVLISLFSLNTFAQRTITGSIKDTNGDTLVGASIVIKGTTVGTVTDIDGKFALQVNTKAKTLIISYTGYETQEISIGTSNTMNIVLNGSTLLQEVVVVGYAAQQRKQTITRAVSVTKQQNFLGRLAGVSIRGKKKGLFKRNNTPEPNETNESYDKIKENGFLTVKDHALSTFSTDVDRAAYTNIRRFINDNQLPPQDAVRIEEMINYFDYKYPQPQDKTPLSISTELTDCPWNKDLKLLHVGLQALTIPTENLPASNLVFLIDVSGSMEDENKLPLLIKSFKLLVKQLREKDKVAIIVYAGAAGMVLEPTSGANKIKIIDALDKLQAGGSTAGGAGIQLAYKIAAQNFIKNGNNRVILATDGDFNVGISSSKDLENLITEKRETGIFLSVLGFGMGNLKDAQLETLADKGNGNYGYIDNILEAQKMFVSEFGGTLHTVAKDVKFQLEFNPRLVQAYRLIGYENRLLNDEDFDDDKKDAGDIGSGHTVTALYEIIPTGVKTDYLNSNKKLKYQETKLSPASETLELVTLKLRYKEPTSKTSQLVEKSVFNNSTPFETVSENLKLSASIAEFGLLLRNSDFKGKSNFEHIIETAKKTLTTDNDGWRAEFIQLVKKAQLLSESKEASNANGKK
jgi:Ca-activated chloride channel homolog